MLWPKSVTREKGPVTLQLSRVDAAVQAPPGSLSNNFDLKFDFLVEESALFAVTY